ncbi:MAG: WecB/TagA/CpsF family glycosyltransferase [Treponema sp.]|nr:WecB/TagA/CpsF family glycosyltransferase [Treponema sp.]
MGIQRIVVAGVPMHVLPREDIEMEILELLAKPGTKQIVFLSVWGFLRARHKGDFRNCVLNADLVLPISKSLIKAALFLKRPVPVRYNPFSIVIEFLSILDSHFKSIYLLGSRNQTLHTAERNVRDTFPSLKILGRYQGYYPKNAEGNIIQAIYKASPAMVLISDGIKEKDTWVYRRRNQFSSSIFLYYKDCFGIFSKRIHRVSEKTFDRGHEIWHAILRNPLKIFLVFPFIHFLFILLFNRLFKK